MAEGSTAVFDRALKEVRRNSVAVETVPHAIDLLNVLEIRDLLDSTADSANEDVAYRSFYQMLPGALDRWRLTIEEQLSTLHPLSDSDSVPPQNWLKLAKTMFKCTECDRIRFWPEVAAHMHHCPKAEKYLYHLPRHPSGTLHSVAWSTKSLQLCDDRASTMLKAYGMDPDTVTCANMDKLDARFACGTCSEPGKSLVVMGWRAAMYHCMTQHLYCEPEWQQVSTAQAQEVRKLEKLREEKFLRLYEHFTRWVSGFCACGLHIRCGLNPATDETTVSGHVRVQHNDRYTVPGVLPSEFYQDRDRLPFMPPAVSLFIGDSEAL
ncbi:hypothetical protein BKA93DRAFT_505530 [Sparassis latifolia]